MNVKFESEQLQHLQRASDLDGRLASFQFRQEPNPNARHARRVAVTVSMDDLQKYMDPSKYTGCAAHQVDRFLQEVIQPILDANAELLGEKAEITV